MSLHLTVEFRDGASASLTALRAGLGDEATLHATMAMGVETSIREHLDEAGYVGRKNALGGKTTGFWKSASQSVASVASADEATVSISHRGVALRYWGGTVVPTKAKALSVPVHPSAHGVYARQYPGKLAFIPAGRAFGPVRQGGSRGDFVGFLVRGEDKVVTRGKNKGKTRVAPVKGGETIYILMLKTTHQPDPNILPKTEAMTTAAAEAGAAYLETLSQ
jgi:hypothetical protein